LTLDPNKVDENGVKVMPNVEEVSQAVIQLLIGQFCVPYPTCSTVKLLQKLSFRSKTFASDPVNIMHVQGDYFVYLNLQLKIRNVYY
jgi:hypothetical protein